MWDVTNARVVRKFYGHSQVETPDRPDGLESELRVSEPGGKRVRIGELRHDGQAVGYAVPLRVWIHRSARNSQCVQTMNDATDSITSVCIDDTSIVSGYEWYFFVPRRSVDGCIRTYDIRAGQLMTEKLPGPLPALPSRVVPVCSISLSRDNQCVVASTTSSTLVLLERKSGTLLNE